MKKFKVNPVIYDWGFWISLIITGLWFVLKIAGVIKTPLWLELIPVAGIIFSIGIFFQKFEQMSEDLHELKKAFKEHDARLVRIEAKLA